jgi:hypothetical protein
VLFDTLTNNVSYVFLFLMKQLFKCVALLCIYVIVIVFFINLYVGFQFFYVCIFI